MVSDRRHHHLRTSCSRFSAHQTHVRFGSKAKHMQRKRPCPIYPNSDRESGHPQTVMSALPPKADMCGATRDVFYGPKAHRACLPQSKYSKAESVPPETPIQKRSIWYGPDLVLGVAATAPLAVEQRRKIGNCLHDCGRLEAEFLGDLGGTALNPERVQPSRRGAIDVPGIGRDEAKLGVGDLQALGGQIVDPRADLVDLNFLDADNIIEKIADSCTLSRRL